MSPSRWVVSVLLVCHLAALVVGAIPDPGEVPRVGPPRYPTHNRLSAALTPALDTVAAGFGRIHALSWRATASLRGLASWYVGLTGLGQRWRMFMNPPTYDEYLQARYYVGRADGTAAPWVAAEIIYPAHREDTIRAVQSFRDSYTDKAVAIALADFLKARDAHRREDEQDTAGRHDPSQALAPIARHAGRRFAARHLTTDERVLRTELWHARVPNPAPGARTNPDVLDARRAVLRRYYEGPVEGRMSSVPNPLGIMQPEADLVWVLQHAEP